MEWSGIVLAWTLAGIVFSQATTFIRPTTGDCGVCCLRWRHCNDTRRLHWRMTSSTVSTLATKCRLVVSHSACAIWRCLTQGLIYLAG
ncbi:hypothetical protein BJ165DRAFT_1501841 [Panaeolus papilionaceus]|nr:hypothetical protein BJ165DRAFT_1501841 [Panaeolus papilionaceus]